ncbi:hypothetical protein FC70_GL001672 [Paucilactobacillus oligofermentans DSM 15707 = LMG 22743]|uniref:Restriction endonuclease type I HsdR N-terminal domain-containing protein n=2 Tax=Paucilactobacillus oligofermentans TaxID=293371 RepID=A0A0R1RDK8_9LACO|nr:hypothetical protein FC70_GL001672 [Paucilactobacillus oligofermentans DSM 15707 = LMG 22743]
MTLKCGKLTNKSLEDQMNKAEIITKINALSERVQKYSKDIATEEATKNALILPFFAALDYDIFNPKEFVPEYTADFGGKKGERVDFAILKKGVPQILIEAKSISDNLETKDSQLFRYFTATKAKFGILTNGDLYKFYTDLEDINVMDKDPFMTISVSELKDNQIPELLKFSRTSFDIEKITDSASDLKYLNLSKDFLEKQLSNPDDKFIKFVLNGIYHGVRTQKVVDQLSPVVKKSLSQVINERVNDKLSSALDTSIQETSNKSDDTIDQSNIENSDIVTTQDEIEAYILIKIILKDVISPDRLFYRDNQSYFNVLADDSNRKWIVRIYFTKSKNYFVLHDNANTSFEFTNITEISNYADKIIKVSKQYQK